MLKILTLNAHSIPEDDYVERLQVVRDMILKEMPDIIGLQEIDQRMDGEEIDPEVIAAEGYTAPEMRERGEGHRVKMVPVRSGNGAALLAHMLAEAGAGYSWTWLPVKLGYDKYDEGLAIFSYHRISRTDSFRISCTDDYLYWKRRAVLGVQVPSLGSAWFYTAHMGWWADTEEPFAGQWSRLNEELAGRLTGSPGQVWLLGDMNSPDSVRGESYDLILRSGWHDIYREARVRDDGYTICGFIDGWRDKAAAVREDQSIDETALSQVGSSCGISSKTAAPGGDNTENIRIRIDYILSSRPVIADECITVFNGNRYPAVSDHFGVMAVLTERTELKGKGCPAHLPQGVNG